MTELGPDHERWTRWLGLLDRQVMLMHLDRFLFGEMTEGIRTSAPESPDIWIRRYARLYGHAQAIAVRRVARGKQSGDAVSLTRLIRDIADHPEVITRDSYVTLYGEDPTDYLSEYAANDFETRWGDGAGRISADKLSRNVSQFMTKIRAVCDVADRVVAHLNETGAKVSLTFAELDASIDDVGAVLNDVSLLLHARTSMLTPTVVGGDWQEPFRQPVFAPFDDDR